MFEKDIPWPKRNSYGAVTDLYQKFEVGDSKIVTKNVLAQLRSLASKRKRAGMWRSKKLAENQFRVWRIK